LRVNGRARVVDDPSLLAELNGKALKAGIEVSIGEVFLHCPKALKRSRLWDPSRYADRSSLPYLGRLILEQTREFAATQEIGAGEPLEKAKELCRRDGKAWSLDDFESGVSGVTMLTVVADDNDRKAYLNRAKALLKQKQPVRTAADRCGAANDWQSAKITELSKNPHRASIQEGAPKPNRKQYLRV
jgi:hypothetical protein